MNPHQLQASGPPIGSSSRLPRIRTLEHNHSLDDQAAAAAAAALLQIKRSPTSAHTPLLPSFQEIHSSYSSAYPTPGSNGDHPSGSSGSLFPYLPPIRTDFQQYNLPGPSGSATSSSITPGYFQPNQTYPPPSGSFPTYQYSPNLPSHSPLPPHSPASPPRKRKRNTLPDLVYQRPAPSSADAIGKGKYPERELPIDVEGDGDPEIEVEATGGVGDEGEGVVRCICGFDVDDGFTIQCERCHVWQHAACFSIPTIDAVPEVYLCERCDPYAASHRRLDYGGARRMQQQRMDMAGTETRIAAHGGHSGSAVMDTSAEPSTGVRGGARKKRTGSPKVERKSRGGAGGVTRRRASSAALHPRVNSDNAGGGARKNSVSNGRRKEKEPSPATVANQTTERRQPLPHPTHYHNTEIPVLPVHHPSYLAPPAPHPHSPAPPPVLPHPPPSSHSSKEPWTEQYVPITQNIVHPAARPVLRSFAHAWRGVTAFSLAETGANDELSPITSCVPMPAPNSPSDNAPSDARKTFLHPLSSALSPPSRPPTYTLHALRPIARQSYVVPYTCAITPSRDYLREPTSQYAQLGIPKQGVHLVPPPLELCLDARGVGGDGRWVRSGCHPNAVLRPVVCEKAKRGKETGMEVPYTIRSGDSKGEQTVAGGLSGPVARDMAGRNVEEEGSRGASDSECSKAGTDGLNNGEEDEGLDVTFGVFATRDLKAEEEIVLGWEWDDRHVVHELPRLLKDGYGSGTPGLKRAMGEVLSTLFSTFTTCACGASAHNCAITQMQKLADLEPPELDHNPDPELLPHEQQQHRTSNLRDQRPHQSPDLGPLIGATRGLRTTDRGQGGRDGVELVSASGNVPSVASVARAFRAAASDSGSDANSHPASPSQKRVRFPVLTPAPELVVSPATTRANAATPSPRKSRERRYSESRSIGTSEDDDDERGENRTWVHKPPKKKARTTPRIDKSPSAVDAVPSDAWRLEDTLPPKMRKNWIKETLRVLNTEGQEIEEDPVGVHPEPMEVDGNDTGVENTSPHVEADTVTNPLQSPTTALAGLSLRASPVEHRIASPSIHDVSASPAAPEPVVSHPSTAVVVLPEKLSSTQTNKADSSMSPSHSLSPTRSPIRSHGSELPLSPGGESKPPTSDRAPISPLLPSSTVNANPISSPTNHIIDAVLPTNEPPLSKPHSPDATPSHSNNLTLELPTISSPEKPPKKPPIKRRTLADWKSRKEKERIAQALLGPPPSTGPQCNGPASVDMPQDHNADPKSAETSSTALHIPAGVHMDAVDSTGPSSSRPPVHELPKEHSETMVSLKAEPPENMERDQLDRNGNDIAMTPQGDVTTAASIALPLPASSPSSLRPALNDPGTESPRKLPSHSFTFEVSSRSNVIHSSPRKFSPRPFREDEEINTSPSTAPLHPPSRSLSRPPSRPRPPPTQPRSSHAPSPTPSLPRSSPPPFVRGGPPPASNSDSNVSSRPRPVPSGPRALRNGHPPQGSSSSSPYHGRGYSRPPSGRGSFHSHNRPFERESDRGWSTRGRGRGGSVSGRSLSGGSDRR